MKMCLRNASSQPLLDLREDQMQKVKRDAQQLFTVYDKQVTQQLVNSYNYRMRHDDLMPCSQSLQSAVDACESAVDNCIYSASAIVWRERV